MKEKRYRKGFSIEMEVNQRDLQAWQFQSIFNLLSILWQKRRSLKLVK
jgi:hypothetical protein